MSEYIKPRKKQPNEKKKEELARRLEEYIEFAHARTQFSDVIFYEALLEHIDNE